MTSFHWVFTSASWLLLVAGAHAQDFGNPDPLFQSNEILEVRIIAPLSSLLATRSRDEELPATFEFTDSAGDAVALDIKLSTRGRFRRDKDNCRFPPLRLNFLRSQTKGTLFQKQDKIKLVTHCQNSSKYADVLVREYIAYRILNVLTDVSFRVRLMRIHYVDTDSERKDEFRYAFAIEHKSRLAKRINKPVLDIPATLARSLQPDYANMISMFHYLLGNTDFSPIKGAPGEACCHNHVLFGNKNEPVWSVPYDFDQAGLVDAAHAAPSLRFKLRNVRQRLYRGRCPNNERLPQTIDLYNDQKENILALLRAVEIATNKNIRKMTKYIEKFYATLASPRGVDTQLLKKCIGGPPAERRSAASQPVFLQRRVVS